MSMHFAPQWVKPIKPTGSLVTPTSESHSQQQQLLSKAAAAPASPFPALGQPRSGSPTTIVPPANPPLSYSRVTHTPASPSMPGEGYFPYAGGEGSLEADATPFPFRYSRDQILAVWDEEKVKERPIELLQLAESGAVIVSQNVVKPVGLRELSELEKKLLSTSVHPPMPTRRPQNAHNNSNADPNASPMRRQQQQSAAAKDGSGSAIQSPITGRAPFGGFGRGEGGVFGGSKFSGALAEGGGSGGGRQPGSIGGGFGGVAKRSAVRRETDDQQQQQQQTRSATASTWRSARNASGTFEGVLGFGNAAPSNTAASDAANGKPDDDAGSWGAAAGQRKWRAAQQDDKPDPAPVAEPAPAPAPAPVEAPAVPTSQTSQPQELGAINWYYRDPNGQEQGPFTGNQMHEWYSHSYFKDDLPVRREHETGFHSLAELKTNTGNAVQPFLSAVRPRLPPNLPIPLSALQAGAPAALPSPTLTDQFHRLNMQGIPPQPQYPNAPFATHYQPQFNGAPAFLGGQQPGWNPAPGPQTPGRMNNGFGSIGGQQFGYGSAIGSRAPDMFGPSIIGQPSTWGAPNPAAAWQQIPGPAPIHAPIPQPQIPMMEPEPYMPVVEPQQQQQAPQQQQQQQQPAVEQQAPVPEPEAEPEQFEEPAHMFDTEEEVQEPVAEDEEEEVVEEETVEEVVEEVEAKPAPSAWGKPASRKSSVLSDATPAVSKLPPAPASLPPKPAPAPKAAEPAPTSPVAAASPVTPSVERSTPKPAPWAAQTAAQTGPSLREIQEAEARQAEARKAARAEARASASPAPVSEDYPSTLSWGLPSQGSKNVVAPPASNTPPAPAWGGAADGPKKTLKQIQEEEERRKHKQEAQSRAAAAAAGATTTKRGYADLAAHAVPSPAQAAAAAAAGWTTVGAAGKVAAAPPKPAPAPVVSKTTVSKPATPPVAPSVPKPIAVAAAKTNGTEETQPSVEFIRWIKQSLTGLNVNIDDFIQMLLQFPIDPPAASRADVLEIISDSVYASSSTLDGRRFAHEFFTKRKADALAQRNRPSVQKVTSLADVVKTQPKQPSADLGFKVVKAKKRRN